MDFRDLEKLGYVVRSKLVKERSLLGGDVVRKAVVVEGRDVLLRLSEIGSRYRLVVIADSSAKEVLEEEGMDVAEIGEDTVMGSASYRSIVEASTTLRRLAAKFATRS